MRILHHHDDDKEFPSCVPRPLAFPHGQYAVVGSARRRPPRTAAAPLHFPARRRADARHRRLGGDVQRAERRGAPAASLREPAAVDVAVVDPAGRQPRAVHDSGLRRPARARHRLGERRGVRDVECEPHRRRHGRAAAGDADVRERLFGPAGRDHRRTHVPPLRRCRRARRRPRARTLDAALRRRSRRRRPGADAEQRELYDRRRPAAGVRVSDSRGRARRADRRGRGTPRRRRCRLPAADREASSRCVAGPGGAVDDRGRQGAAAAAAGHQRAQGRHPPDAAPRADRRRLRRRRSVCCSVRSCSSWCSRA